MRTAIYAGSFDPITNGHLDIIHRAMQLFDKLIIVVAQNSAKKTMFTLEERLRMTEDSCGAIAHVADITYNCKMEFDTLPDSEMLVSYAARKKAKVMIRGLRPVQDFPGEFALASVNRRVDHSIETVMLITDPSVSEVSSSMVKELVALGGPYEQFVPENVAATLQSWKKQNET